jgi:hypothetical protein
MTSTDVITEILVEMNRSAAKRLSGMESPIRETPEQQTVCFDLLGELLHGAPSGLRLRSTQLQVAELLDDDFPGLGGVDLTIENDDGPAALIELKFGIDTLWNSVWDLCKLALALRNQVAERAYMLGGAPPDSWDRERQGPDLFVDAEFSTVSLLTNYANCFRQWKTAPLRLPSTIRVGTVDSVAFTSGDSDYEMRLVEVFDDGSDWLEVHDGLGLRPD